MSTGAGRRSCDNRKASTRWTLCHFPLAKIFPCRTNHISKVIGEMSLERRRLFAQVSVGRIGEGLAGDAVSVAVNAVWVVIRPAFGQEEVLGMLP